MRELSRSEAEGLTIWVNSFSAQIRGEHMAVVPKPGLMRFDSDGAALIPLHEIAKLRALLNEAERRGAA